MVVNDVDGTIYVGGAARAVTQWQGRVILDNKTNVGAFVEHYVITIAVGNNARSRDQRHRRRLGRRRPRRLRHEPARQHRAQRCGQR